jgi:hypothetical protein
MVGNYHRGQRTRSASILAASSLHDKATRTAAFPEYAVLGQRRISEQNAFEVGCSRDIQQGVMFDGCGLSTRWPHPSTVTAN